MPLELEDVRTWDKPRCEKERRERLERVKEIRDEAGGSLAQVTEPERQDEVREKHAELNVIGERADQITELEAADAEAKALEEALETPNPKVPQPGQKGRKGQPEIEGRDAGLIFAESAALKRFREDGAKDIEAGVPIGAMLPELKVLEAGGVRLPHTKDVLGEGATAATYPPFSARVGPLVEQLFQIPNVADLMPQTTVDQPAVPFVKETVTTQAAVETAEGAALPEASITFTESQAPVRKIGVILPVTEEILEDESLVRGHINARLPLFIRMREDAQLLNGSGAGQNLQGILGLSGVNTSTTYSIAAATAQDKLERIFSASIRVAEAFLVADAAILGLGLWEQIRKAKDSTGQYLIAPATEQAAPRVWGLRVVTNQNMPAEAAGNKPIVVGAFSQASQIWRRRQITLAVSDSHNDNFAKDVLVVKARNRLAVTHYRPAGYAVVTSNA